MNGLYFVLIAACGSSSTHKDIDAPIVAVTLPPANGKFDYQLGGAYTPPTGTVIVTRDYTAGYGDHVLIIEYRMQDFTTGCSAYPNLSIVLRDVNLVPAGSTGYIYDGC